MIILEQPYVSPEMASYLAETGTPVLDNAAARQVSPFPRLTLVDDAEFARMVNAGARLYTTSENALEWVGRHVEVEAIRNGVDSMKDKHRLRAALADLYPGYFFREIAVDELAAVDPADLPLPVVLKPVVGFFSVGVYVIATAGDWRAAVADIAARRDQWRRDYPESVVGDGRFIVEGYIDGDEYAVDAYFDGDGRAVVLNIMRHDFASAADVSDRLYYTSPEIIRSRLVAFTEFLDRAGAILGLRNFPLHAEIRLSDAGIIPIEFNPLRFAGWCTTDLAWFAYGLRTYEYYLGDRRPDWDALLAGREGNIYSLIILDKPAGTPDDAVLDYQKVAADFTDILHLRKIDFPGSPVFAFLFTRTPAENKAELERIMRSNLAEYIETR